MSAGPRSLVPASGRAGVLVRLAVPVVAVAVLVVVAVVAYGRGSDSVPVPDRTRLPAQPADVGFASDMWEHHQQALQMVLLVLGRDTSSEVRTLATEMVTDQQRESGQLMQFLADRGVDLPTDPERTVMGWMDDPVPRSQMPGLASQDQMTALTNAQGADFERQFLELMVKHHEGGVHMAQAAQQRAESQQIRDLAARMALVQQREITEMQQLLGPAN
jgi:uncharacterized protein (DUF305 family)